MGYDEDFYVAYENYLRENKVRSAHDAAFRFARCYHSFDRVVDLGCGCSREFLQFAKPDRYFGVDVNDDTGTPQDYRTMQINENSFDNLKPTSFVSLFSIEITAPASENYEFYRSLFDRIPTLQAGLVSGFFYANRKDHECVEEIGGIRSYQTIEDIDTVQCDTFTEYRLTMPVPSKMFGDDVFEVWKVFLRNNI